MKLNILVALAMLFCNASNALVKNSTGYDDVVLGEMPSHVGVGQQVQISWSTPRDYVRTIPPAYLLSDAYRIT